MSDNNRPNYIEGIIALVMVLALSAVVTFVFQKDLKAKEAEIKRLKKEALDHKFAVVTNGVWQWNDYLVDYLVETERKHRMADLKLQRAKQIGMLSQKMAKLTVTMVDIQQGRRNGDHDQPDRRNSTAR